MNDLYERQSAAAFRKIVELGYCWSGDGWMLPQKDAMLDQLAKMQAELDRLRNPMKDVQEYAHVPVKQVAQIIGKLETVAEPKADGRKAGWTPERRAAAAERMRERQTQKKLEIRKEIQGNAVPKELLQQQMRPPTDAPMPKPRTNSKGGTVVKVSDAALKQGFKP